MKDNRITPSTYRQCRKGRYNMGFKIIKTLGTITIVITDEITSTGYVSYVTDELVEVFTVNEQVSFED